MCNCPECGDNKTSKHKSSSIISAACLAGVFLMLVTTFSGCKSVEAYEQVSVAKIEKVQEETEEKTQQSEQKENELFTLAMVPEYSGNAYVDINDDVPFFSEDELTEEPFQDCR